VSAPVELYRFTIQASVWTWTSGDAPVTYNGATYTPEPIGRGAMEQGKEINRANLTLRLPRDNALASLYLSTVPDFPASLTVYRQEGTTTLAYWKGRIAGAKATGSEVELDCESAFTSLRRTGLRARYQVGCRHALYHRGCGLSLEDWGVTDLLSAVNGKLLTVAAAALQPDGFYTGGLVRAANGVLRWVTAHTGEALTVSRAFDGLEEELANSGYGNNYGNFYGGYAVTIYPGCDRTTATCNSKFNNILNFGGFPWIPSRNPFDGSSIV
jgi:uncharacterized phage protein (TIGR02218 family)